MGHRPVVTTEPRASARAVSRGVPCDQVVFTSVRDPTGEGYRIIAASPGVRAEERAEITRRSPSHESLCDVGSAPVGLLSYVLASGRRCVAYICHAGVEHTARGGQRVYTHMALLDQAGYRRFDCDPVAAHAALGQVVDREGPVLKPVARLEPIDLSPGPGDAPEPVSSAPRPAIAAEWIWPVADAVLGRRHMVLAGAAAAHRLLQWALLSVPRAVREQVDASVGVSFSPARPVQIVLLPAGNDPLERRLASQQVRLLRTEQTPPTVDPSSRAWFSLIGRWWREGRLTDIVQLTSRTCANTPVDALGRLAAICEDLDALRDADAAKTAAIIARYERVLTSRPCEQVLVGRLLAMARQRVDELAETACTHCVA